MSKEFIEFFAVCKHQGISKINRYIREAIKELRNRKKKLISIEIYEGHLEAEVLKSLLLKVKIFKVSEKSPTST